ncbi:MAG: mRNA-decapping enzyme subunit 2 [Watsoniomyces obsoletus]|nr:MAG: mRNA-decapping enzyme subunit 2 [Watsoniomyces obsoletus]
MAQKKLKIEDWLDDLSVRFLVNLPQEDLQSVERICFQVEEAQWFYEDFVRPLDKSLPSMGLRDFCFRIFQHCPLFSQFSQHHHAAAFAEFLTYRTRVPVRGAILLNDDMDHVLLVKGWTKRSSWSFPRGKINKDETDLDCAVREVYEETGYDITEAGLVTDEQSAFEMTLQEQNVKLYVFRGVPMDTQFEPKTRKEISKIQWHRVSDLPPSKKAAMQQQQQGREGDAALKSNSFYMVGPFLNVLKKWIAAQKKAGTGGTGKVPPRVATISQAVQELAVPEPEVDRESSPSFEALVSEETSFRAPLPMETAVQPPSETPITILSRAKPTDRPAPSQPSASNDQASQILRQMLSIRQEVQALPSSIRPTVTAEDQAAQTAKHNNGLLALLHGHSASKEVQTDQNAKPVQVFPSASAMPGSSLDASANRSQELLSSNGLQAPALPIPVSAFANGNLFAPSALPHPALHQSLPSQQAAAATLPRNMNSSSANTDHRGSLLAMFKNSQQHAAESRAEQSAEAQNTLEQLSERHGNTMAPAGPQFSTIHSTTVPSSSQLPPPKLTTHSLQLLSVFKNGSNKMTSAEGSSEVRPSNSSMKGNPAVFGGKVELGGPSSGLTTNEHARTAAPTKQPMSTSVRQSSFDHRAQPPTEHRTALLSLFSKPSPAINTTRSAEATAMPMPPFAETFLPPPPVAMPSTALSTNDKPTHQAASVNNLNNQASQASQMTTTQSNRDFLLGFLDSVGKGRAQGKA